MHHGMELKYKKITVAYLCRLASLAGLTLEHEVHGKY